MARFIKIGLCLLLIALICSEINAKKPPKDRDRKKKDKPLDKIKGLVKIVSSVFTKGEMVWSIFEQIGESLMPHSDFGDDDEDEDEDLENTKINKLSADLSDFKNELFQKLNIMANIQDLKDKTSGMNDRISEMENFMDRFARCTNLSSTIEISSLEKFAEDVDSDDSHIGPQLQLRKIRKILKANEFTPNFFQLLTDRQLVETFMGPTGRSVQQFVYAQYQKYVMLEVYGYMMIVYGANIKKALTKKSDEWLLEKESAALTGYCSRVGEMFNETKHALADASREVWRTDPMIHKEGETYKRLDPIFQTYIAHETDAWRLGTPSYHQKCDSSCDALDKQRHWTCSSDVCRKQEKKQCRGVLRDCKFITDPTICFSNDAYRRYESIETEGRVFGKASACKKNEFEGEGSLNVLDPSKLDTNLPNAIIQTVVGFSFSSHCSYCMCTCESWQSADRFIHIQPVMADVDDNKVITGVQFVFVNKILHIQIQQGELAPYGHIKRNTAKWKPVHNFTVLDEDIREGFNYTMIKWNNRTVLLDELHPPNDMNNTVLVGLQIEGTNKSNEFRLKLYLKEFDFNTGILKKELPSVEVNNEWSVESDTERTEVEIDHPDVPTNYHQHQPITESNKYVKFTTTDLKKDAGQNVIPFIDIQPVITNPPVPISGAGLILKSEKNSGGFLALELFTLNIEPFIHGQEPSNAPKFDENGI